MHCFKNFCRRRKRFFIKLSLVKTILRSQEKLSVLVMLSAKQELAETLDYNDIINTLAVP